MRFAVRLLALAATLAVLAAAPPDPLAALALASGHAGTIHFHGTARRIIERRTVTTTFDELGAMRLFTRCIAEVCGGVWFDGRRAWTFGLNDVLVPQEADASTAAMRTLFAIDSYAFTEPAFREGGGSAAGAGPGRWRVRAREGSELIAIVDPATQTIRRVETPAGSLVAEYGREVRVGGGAFALERSSAFGSVALDAAIALAGPIVPPAGPLARFSGEAPLQLGSEPIPIVPCTLAGRAARCLIDTGAVPSAMTLPLADALHLEPHGELEIAGIGRFATGFVEAGPLVLGPARFEGARFAVIPPSSAARFDAVIGADLLARVRVRFDRARGTALILPPGTSPPVQTAIPLSFRDGTPMVEAAFGAQAQALLDTGDQAILSFGYAMYREGPQWPVVGRAQAAGVAGIDDVLTVEVPGVRIGPLLLGTTRATVRRTQVAPHVGIGLWSRYEVDLDEAAGRIAFTPR